MASLKEKSICLMSTTTGVDSKTAAATTLFIVPPGKSFIPTMVIIRNNSVSLVGGTSYSFTNWLQTIDLSGLTVTNGYRVLQSVTNTTYTPIPAGSAFQITVTTGSTLASTSVFDVFGYLI